MAPSKLSSDARKKLAANLQVLRRYDSEIQAIIDTTSHVVLYQFQHDTSSWAKKDVEGALFIFQRASAPCYGFMVMNRLSLDNYTELLNPEMNFQPSDQFLIYRSDGGDVIGIWIYEESDRIRISSQLEKCCKSAKSAFSGQSPQRLFPKNAEEEREFLRSHPRSRSNSRREHSTHDAHSNAEDLTALISRTRMQQQQVKRNSGLNPASNSNSSSGIDLVSKLQALGLDPSGGSGGHGQGAATPKPNALPSDPAIVLARKSSTAKQEAGTTMKDAQETAQPADVGSQRQLQQHKQPYMPSAGEAAAFRSPLPLPTSHVQHVAPNVAPNMMIPPASPTLHPVPSPFPPSTLATPLPGNGTPGLDTSAPQQQQAPVLPQFWHGQMGHPGENRSAHASPAPPPNYGMVPGMYAFPQLVHGQPGSVHHPPMPMAPPHFVPGGLPPPLPAAASAADQVQPGVSQPPGQQAPLDANASGRPNTSVAHNLAEQLVSLVRQRMTMTQQPPPPAGSSASPVAAGPAAVPDATKMQREFCRSWLIHVIQSDDELVDAFAQRFPPPIFPQQPQQLQQPQQQQRLSDPSAAQV